MDEAGRAPESPLIVAPPGLEMDPEVKARDAVTENGVMSEDATTSNGAASHHNGAGAGESSRRVPFPADEIGNKKGSAHLVTESDAASNGSAAEPKDSDDRSDGRVSTASGVLDSGRQAVKQAMAATTNWFSPSGKSGASDSDEAAAAPRHAAPAVPGGSIMAPPPSSSGSGAPGPSVFAPGERRPTFTATSTATSAGTATAGTASSPRDTATPSAPAAAPAPPTPSTSSPQTGPGGASSLWREVRPHPGPPSAPTSFSAAATGTRPSGPGTAPSAPGARPSGPGPGTGASSSGGSGFSAAGAASAVGGAAAGLASSVTSAFQGRNAGGKRKRRSSVRRSSKRQAQLTLSRVEPWSVMKFSFVVSVVAFIILFVAVAVLYMVLSALGVFTSLQHTVTTITSSQGSAGTNISNWFSMSRILGYTGMLGALNIVLITAMSTIGAVIYNLIASTIGGVEVTLRETD